MIGSLSVLTFRFIDQGDFGEVYQGTVPWYTSPKYKRYCTTAVDILGQGTGPTSVAVKTLRKGSTAEEQKKFLLEQAVMR